MSPTGHFGFRLRSLAPGEEGAVSELALASFEDAVAKDLSADGIAEFRRYAAPEEIAARRAGSDLLLAEARDGTLLGVVELTERRHVAMLFVAASGRGRGVGRALLERALELCAGAEHVTVHAALDAVGFYERMGFRPLGPERTETGIRYVPMQRPGGHA